MKKVDLINEKKQLKDKAYSILDSCKEEIRALTEEEDNELSEIKKRIAEINKMIEEIESKSENEVKDEENKEEVKEEKEETESESETKSESETEKEDEEEKDETSDDEKMDEKEEEKEEEKRNIIQNNINKNFKTMVEFRLLKAINDVANNRTLDEISNGVVNQGVEEMRKSGLSYSGQIQIPVEELRGDITVTNEGEDTVAVELWDVMEPLRAKNVLVQAGASFLTNLTGDVQVPTMTSENVYWEGETAEAKDGAGEFSSVKLSPKRLTAYIDISKQFLIQESVGAEELIRRDLINAINSKLESTILGTGAGSTTEPAGLFKEVTTTIEDFEGICDLEAAIDDSNVIGECKYVMSNKARAKFRNMPKSALTNELVLSNNTLDGTEVLNTSHVAETNLAYGDFSQLIIGQWGALDLVVDPYTLSKQGKIRIVINTYFDAKLVRNEAIVVAKV